MRRMLPCLIVAVAVGLAAEGTPAATNVLSQARLQALKRVLPPCDNALAAAARTFADDGREWTFYVGRHLGRPVGAAFVTASERGYHHGHIEVVVGVLTNGTVNATEVIRAENETPGLGTRVKSPEFRDQFKGRPAANPGWAAVTKDGGEIQAITGATISSRAVTEAPGSLRAPRRRTLSAVAPAAISHGSAFTGTIATSSNMYVEGGQ